MLSSVLVQHSWIFQEDRNTTRRKNLPADDVWRIVRESIHPSPRQQDNPSSTPPPPFKKMINCKISKGNLSG